MVVCKFCSSADVFKNGYVRNHKRYKCKSCLKNFTLTPLRGVPYKDKLKALALYSSGLSMKSHCSVFWCQCCGGDEVDSCFRSAVMP